MRSGTYATPDIAEERHGTDRYRLIAAVLHDYIAALGGCAVQSPGTIAGG
jgi:hypothetical protein